MKHVLTWPFALILLFATSCFADSTLFRISRLDSSDLTQISLVFDTQPESRHQITGKRIDVFLSQTSIDSNFAFPEEDKEIVKYLIDTREETTILSFFLRYPPQKVTIEKLEEDKLILEILAGNEYSDVYRDFSQKFGGLSVVQDDRMDYTNPLVASPYTHNWKSFFEKYTTPVSITAPVRYTLPEFPVLSLFPDGPQAEKATDSIPPEALVAGQEQLWTEVQSSILSFIRTEYDVEAKKRLALTHGEAMLRMGDWEDAYRQFYLLEENYPDELVGFWSKYFLIYMTAEYNDPYLASLEADDFAQRVPVTSNLSSYVHLLRVETALSTGKTTQMRTLLQDPDVALPDNLLPVYELRRSDQLWTSKKYVPAYAAYRTIDRGLIESHPYSLNGYCDSLFRFKQYEDGAECYQKLGNYIENFDDSGLVSYRYALSKVLSGDHKDDLTGLFESVENTYPGTYAGFIAAIKKNDHRFLLSEKWMQNGVQYYRALAENAPWKDISEEAYLKEAIGYYLMDEPEKAIPVLMKLIRDFRKGGLRLHAEALLLRLLPEEIKRLIAAKMYIQALALAKQNRIYFERNWIDKSVFPKLADAFLNSNLNQEAQRAYMYLYDIAPPDQKEDYFLPLIKAIFDQGKYYQVDDYASQYSYLYPEGKHSFQILEMRLQALSLLGKYEKAMQLLPDPIPDDPELRNFAASIYFHNDNFQKTEELLSPLSTNILQDEELFMLAESFFHNQKNDQALPLYSSLIEKDFQPEQSMFRLAQIENRKGNREKSLKYYETIVEKGEDSLWSKYAERELRLMELSDSINNTLNN